MNRTRKTLAAIALSGGLALGAVGLGAGVASAAPVGGPIAEHPGWGPPPGPGWGPPPPPPPAWNNGWNGGGPIPGGWNGGWEPQGGFCVFVVCV
jgi:hypothetical protein